jgi:hypothetical protein
MSDDDARDAGFDDFLDAVEEGDPYYLESPSGNGWLPPRQFDPETGERELTEKELPETGEVLTTTVTNVAGPSFAEDTPYVVAVAQFGPVRITGQIPGSDAPDIGDHVTIAVGESQQGERVIRFQPA